MAFKSLASGLRAGSEARRVFKRSFGAAAVEALTLFEVGDSEQVGVMGLLGVDEVEEQFENSFEGDCGDVASGGETELEDSGNFSSMLVSCDSLCSKFCKDPGDR